MHKNIPVINKISITDSRDLALPDYPIFLLFRKDNISSNVTICMLCNLPISDIYLQITHQTQKRYKHTRHPWFE